MGHKTAILIYWVAINYHRHSESYDFNSLHNVSIYIFCLKYLKNFVVRYWDIFKLYVRNI